ncbi:MULTISPECIES: DJ-1/PfpI family protein [unclassified Streptomyces]|uniref:GlxA family transcriptional regulator n=1 Tax=Streptomyces TaxID=1883 RepID=UPI0013E34FFC|nr:MULTISPECIES: DJ-1/PfpI family protein [unclassified Streptomyces]UQA32341.1 DJ-1/PfpI family protein [Streptomyces sp. HNA39]
MADKNRRVLIVAYGGSQIIDIASVAGALEIANSYGANPQYSIELGTLARRAIATSAGISLHASHTVEAVTGPLDTLVVAGGAGCVEAAESERLLVEISRLARRSRRIASVCTGAFVLAAAGLLDGRRVTTHWGWAAQLAERHPAVAVDVRPLYIRDGNVYTAAGVTSALDMTLSLIEEDHGPTLARAVARELVVHLHRQADQAQISVFLSSPLPEARLVRDVTGYITSNLTANLTPSALAARAGVSTRHLTRLFNVHLETTPARAVRAARTEAAVLLVRSSSLPLAAIARRCGFTSEQTLRQAFRDLYGCTGDKIRRMPDMPQAVAGRGGENPGS